MADWRSWLRRTRKEPVPALAGMSVPREPKLRFWQKKDYSVTDAILVGIGVGLAAAAATFPWYVFFNQDQFGYAVVKFDPTPTASDLSGPFYIWKPWPSTSRRRAPWSARSTAIVRIRARRRNRFPALRRASRWSMSPRAAP